MKTLVTGGTGYLGSALVRKLLHNGVEVRILRRNTSSLESLGDCAKEVEHAVGDLTDPDSLEKAMQGVNHVYNVAALVAIPARPKGLAQKLVEVNVEGTANVVNSALSNGIERLVHTSSIAAHGRPNGRSITTDETAVWVDTHYNSRYAVSKYKSELQVHRAIAEGLDAVIVNPSVIFGPGLRADDFTPMLFKRIISAKLWPNSSALINTVDVDDVAEGHILAMEKGRCGERYTLGGENHSWNKIAEIFCDAAGVSSSKINLPQSLVYTGTSLVEFLAYLGGKNPPVDRITVRSLFQSWSTNSDKAISELGYSFRPLEETARRMAEAFC